MEKTLPVTIDFYKLNKASTSEVDEVMIRNLTELLSYRRKLAIAVLRCNDDVMNKTLAADYERIEWYIKQVLAL